MEPEADGRPRFGAPSDASPPGARRPRKSASSDSCTGRGEDPSSQSHPGVLHASILAALQRRGRWFRSPSGWHAFALPLSIRRYSEDLDFSLERPGPATISGRTWRRSGRTWTGRIRCRPVEGQRPEAVHAPSCASRAAPRTRPFRPPGGGPVGRIEVDTRPPAGATLETTVVRRHVLLRIQHQTGHRSWPKAARDSPETLSQGSWTSTT